MSFFASVPFTFFDDVDIEIVTKLRENNIKYPGIFVDEEPIREYVMGETVVPYPGPRGENFLRKD